MTDSTLAEFHPEYVPGEGDLAVVAEELHDAYQDYTKHVSPANMAMSLEACSYILWAARKLDVTSAADFGSGFTSYVLRLVCDDVWSVDDSPEWLEWTARFLNRHGRQTGNLTIWDDYKQLDLAHDVIVYDFSSGEMRDANFNFAIGQLRPGGIGIMDDANHQGHQTSMYKAAHANRFDLFGLQDWTKDYVNRFAALVVR